MRHRSIVRNSLAVVSAAAIATTLGLSAASADDDVAQSSVAHGLEMSVGAGPDQLDPDTFEGPVLVGTAEGEVFTTVAAGELRERAAVIRADVAEGRMTVDDYNRSTDAVIAAAGCQDWQMAVGGPGVYWTSTPGCALFGYPGMIRSYQWANNSNGYGCANALGFSGPDANNAYTPTFWGIGCVGGGSVGSGSVVWGNVLAYTKTQGMSISLPSMKYNWYD